MNDHDRWQTRYEVGSPFPTQPSQVVTALANRLPKGGRALDVAGGAGRHAVWLAQQGLNVTLCDLVPNALARTEELAARAGVTVDTMLLDAESDPLPDGPWDVILSFHFLHRPLFGQWQERLTSGGVLIFVQPTVRNLEKHERPPRRFLLEEGELARLVEDSGLEVLHLEEDWLSDGRHEACVVARRFQ